MILFGLYCNTTAWEAPLNANALNVLQYAAKIHESLILASLSSVLLDIAWRKLLAPNGGGLRLGLLSAPFQINSPMYLLSHEFRASLSGKGSILTTALVLYFFVLAAVTGPSAASIMVPKLDWWPMVPTDSLVVSINRAGSLALAL